MFEDLTFAHCVDILVMTTMWSTANALLTALMIFAALSAVITNALIWFCAQDGNASMRAFWHMDALIWFCTQDGNTSMRAFGHVDACMKLFECGNMLRIALKHVGVAINVN